MGIILNVITKMGVKASLAPMAVKAPGSSIIKRKLFLVIVQQTGGKVVSLGFYIVITLFLNFVERGLEEGIAKTLCLEKAVRQQCCQITRPKAVITRMAVKNYHARRVKLFGWSTIVHRLFLKAAPLA
ncbi:hypothetical protein [Endozoicomonas sp. 2B-B]